MKQNYPKLINAVFLLFLTALFSTFLMAQNRPLSVILNANNDDDNLCGFKSSNNDFSGTGKLANTQFCRLYKDYIENKDGNELGQRKARDSRNEMINLVVGQIDSYYKFRKGDRRMKIRWFQMVLDFLEIGGATAISIMNGERAKSIVGAGIAGIQGGRTQANKNFEVLSTQTLINKMNTKRDTILLEIIKKLNSPVTAEKYSESYPWYAAKNDLRRYLIAGTFDDALDSLVEQTGAEAEKAEKALREVGPQSFTPVATEDEEMLAREAAKIKADLRKKFKGTDTEKEAARKKLGSIVAALEADDEIQKLLDDKEISSEIEDGEKTLNGLRDIIIEQTKLGRAGRDIVATINRAFIEN